MGRKVTIAAFCVVALLLSLSGGPSVATASTPSAWFFGVVPQGPLAPSDYKRMRGVIGTIRIPIFWAEVEPQRGRYDFSGIDDVVGRAAEAGIGVLPFVWGSPRWIAADPARPPLDDSADRKAWALILRKLVGRYGPHGTFWQGRSAVRPVRRWQIWNEPNFRLFWKPQVSSSGYARLLRIAAGAIHSRDPGARIILAGVAPIEGSPPPWVYLRHLLQEPGVTRDFDAVGLHPYAGSLLSLRYQIEQARLAMSVAGAGKVPLEITEFGVASGVGLESSMVKSPAGQASFLRRAYELLLQNRRRWRISGADWFTWRDGTRPDPHCIFCQGAGLLDAVGAPKPAWSAYRRLAG